MFDTFNLQAEIHRFGIFKMFFPLSDSAQAEPNGVHLILFHFIVVREGCLTLSIYWRKFTALKSWNISPKETPRKQNPMGSIWYSSILLWIEKGIWHFQFTCGYSPFWKSWKCFIPPRESAKAEPNGVHMIFFPFYCVREVCLTLTIYGRKFTVLKSWKCFIPQRDSTKADPVSIWYSFHFIVLEKCVWHFQFTGRSLTFFFQILQMFILQSDFAKAEPYEDHLKFSPFLLSKKWCFKLSIYGRKLSFLKY